MGKPIKLAADYYYHDADMRNDIKVKALRRRFGAEGYAVWNYLLEVLTDSEGFVIEFSDLTKELLAADFDITVERLTEIVDYCCTLELLQRADDGRGIFSRSHQARLQAVLDLKDKRRRAGKAGMAARWGVKDAASNNTSLQSNNTVITPNNEENRKEENGTEQKGTGKKIEYPYQAIADLWNKCCTALPKVQTLNDARRQKIKARLSEFGKGRDVWLATAESLFETIAASDFLCGTNNNGWTATFDWVMANSKNWVKVLEGNYDNNRGRRGAQPQRTSAGVQLGAGEYIEPETGRRTYGSGRVTIPDNAPARPSERYAWNETSQNWVLL